ncbi:MAG: class F sortase [Actinomycetota bacterium]|nr:class F sortase [Actinomycetota bacterium]
MRGRDRIRSPSLTSPRQAPGPAWLVWLVALAAPLLSAGGVAAAVTRPPTPLAVGTLGDDRLPGPGPIPVLRPAPGPAAIPLTLEMPSIGVATSLIRLGLGPDGNLDPPGDFGVAGWWTGGSAPGNAGPAVIVGHVDTYRDAAVFYKLRQLAPGDPVLVSRSDGSVVRFEVQALRQFAKDSFPTEAVYGPTAEPTLRLITCGGAFDRTTRSYRDNIVAFARLVPSTPASQQPPVPG